jgi:hypothetical protein
MSNVYAKHIIYWLIICEIFESFGNLIFLGFSVAWHQIIPKKAKAWKKISKIV